MKPILLVDDSKTVLLYMTSALQKQGYEVVAVEDGESALEVLTHRKDIQFVLSDLMMPGLSGIDLCRVLKSAAFERYIFFVLLSSRNDQGSIVKGIDAGADDFVDKKNIGRRASSTHTSRVSYSRFAQYVTHEKSRIRRRLPNDSTRSRICW